MALQPIVGHWQLSLQFPDRMQSRLDSLDQNKHTEQSQNKQNKYTDMPRMVCPYLTGNTLRLSYDPNRLMLSIGLWRWYINITIIILDIIHRPGFYLKLNSTL
jgi:hypothetical protein